MRKQLTRDKAARRAGLRGRLRGHPCRPADGRRGGHRRYQEAGFVGCFRCSLSWLWQAAENLFVSRLSLTQPINSLP
jgi:hypothetical protein